MPMLRLALERGEVVDTIKGGSAAPTRFRAALIVAMQVRGSEVRSVKGRDSAQGDLLPTLGTAAAPRRNAELRRRRHEELRLVASDEALTRKPRGREILTIESIEDAIVFAMDGTRRARHAVERYLRGLEQRSSPIHKLRRVNRFSRRSPKGLLEHVGPETPPLRSRRQRLSARRRRRLFVGRIGEKPHARRHMDLVV